MWLVGKDTTGTTGRIAISDTLRAALVRWYTGHGTEADHRASVSLVSTARENHKWIACDCLGERRAPPLMSAAYLSFTTAIDYERERVHARLRSAAKKWPDEFAPQAFLLLEANELTSSEVVTGLGTVEIRNRIQHTGIIRAEVEPPFLVLAVVGEHSRREGYRALPRLCAAGLYRKPVRADRARS
jgi:hypothetical protein